MAVRICWFFVLVFSHIILYGQDDSEKDTVAISILKLDDRINSKAFDYDNLNLFQNYRVFKNGLPIARSGNLGLPIHYFDSISSQTNLEYILGGYTPYIINKDRIKLYDTNVPFTSLSYVTGAEKEQLFSVLHTQNFGRRMNVSFQYDRITSEGFFSRQLTNHTKFNANYRFTSFNNRFKSIGYYAITSLESLENGGIVISEEENLDDNTILLDINLRNAQNQLKYKTFGFINEYTLSRVLDSNSNEKIILGHEFELITASRKYSDLIASNGDFYANNFIDTVQTIDSTFGREVNNSVYVKLMALNLKAGLKNSKVEYFQNFLIENEIHSNYVFANFTKITQTVKIISSIEKGISGFHRKEHDLNLQLSFRHKNRISYYGIIVSKTKRPNPLMNSARLNHYFYDKSLKNVNENRVEFGISDTLSATNVSISYQQNKNLVYFNEESIIENYDKNINVIRIRIKNRTKLLNHFYAFNQVSLQLSSVDSIVPIPNFISYTSLYYQNDFFEKSLRLQLGADFYYISEYNRLNYNPALAQFNRIQNEKYSSSNLQLDVFLNLRINRSAKVFFKMENIIQPSFSEDSYRIQGYAIPGRALKVGIFWRMLN